MNRLFHIQAMLVLLTMAMPTVCMKKDRLVRFAGDFNVISIKESNLGIMGAWDSHYKKHKAVVDSGGIVPQFTNVSADELDVVNNALNVGAYKFGEYYNDDKKLSSDDKRLLIKASGLYDDDGKRLKLYVPELITQLIDVYFTDDGLRDYVKSFCKHDDQDDVRNHFKKKLIVSKGLMLKKPMLTDMNDHLRNDIYPGSFFLNGYYTNNYCDCAIPLPIGKAIHQTYASHFVTDTYELRITDKKDKRCSLWIIDHHNLNDTNYTFSKKIKHKGTIKGCCFSKTGTGVEYVVTYSDCDMVFSKITMQNNVAYIESWRHYPPVNSSIVDVCFNHTQDRLVIGTYQGMESVVIGCTMGGKFFMPESFLFKEHGLLQKMFITHNTQGDFLIVVFGVAGQYATHLYKLDNGGARYAFQSSTQLNPMGIGITPTFDSWMCKRGNNSVFMYDFSYSPFAATVEQASQKVEKNWFVKEYFDDSVLQLDSECYRVYSPEGKFLLCNSLIKKAGAFYVKTILKDAATHKQILSIDTLYKDFAGIGFSRDGKELIFLNSSGPNYKVSLLNDQDNVMMDEVEKVVLSNLGTTSLLKRLCMEYKEKGELALLNDDPARRMLLDWAKEPMMAALLKTCLPFYTIHNGIDKK